MRPTNCNGLFAAMMAAVALCHLFAKASEFHGGMIHNDVLIAPESTRLHHHSEGGGGSGYFFFVLRKTVASKARLLSNHTASPFEIFRREYSDLLNHEDYHVISRHVVLVYCSASEISDYLRRSSEGPAADANILRQIHHASGPAAAGFKLHPELRRAIDDTNCFGPEQQSKWSRVKIGLHLAWRQDTEGGEHSDKLQHHLRERHHLWDLTSRSPGENLSQALHGPDPDKHEMLQNCVAESLSHHGARRSGAKGRSVFVNLRVNAGEDGSPKLCHCRRFFTEVARLPYVRWVEMAPIFASQNSVATKTMQHPTDYTRPLWQHDITGQGQLVAVGDTGLDFDSCYFRDDAHRVTFYPETNPEHRKVLSYQECQDDGVAPDHMDHQGAHGTHVTGSLAGNSLGGGPEFNGLAKDAVIFFQDLTCTGDSSGLLLPPDTGDYFQPAYDVGARISSNSWGSGDAPKTYGATDRLTDRFCYQHQDFLVVFAAGNNPVVGVLTPATSKNVLTVGAHNNNLDAGVRDSLASFSAHGPTFDGRLKPEVTGPGNPVISAYSDGKFDSNQCTTSSKSGTSMATPLVSAAAVLLRQYLAEGYHPSGVKNASDSLAAPTSSAMKALMIQSGARMQGSAGSGFPNSNQGFGRVELDKVCHIRSDTSSFRYKHQHIIDQRPWPIRHKETIRYCFAALARAAVSATPVGETLKVTLVWIDAASAAEGSARSLVNDLDLVVVAGDGSIYYSNGLSEGTFDRLNNVEQVWLRGRVPDVFFAQPFQVIVYGADVLDYGPYGGQPFSVVVWGPGLEQADDAVCAVCPASCRGQGTCVRGQCQCSEGYEHVDCSQCDADAVCHGNGKCDSSLRCECGPHVSPVSSDCSFCAAGWFGPHCDGSCQCGSHGVCNETSGRCNCSQDRVYGGGGCWSFADCSRCCDDFGGAQCNERSYWCHNKKIRELTNLSTSGLIQINGDPQYPSSTACRWRLSALQPTWTIRLTFLSFRTEDPYDFLKIFDGPSDADAKLVKRYTGSAANNLIWTSSTRDVFLYFQSDMLQDDSGFVIKFDIIKSGGCAAVNCNERGTCNEATLECQCRGNFDPLTACATCSADFGGPECDVSTNTPEPSVEETPVPRFTDHPAEPPATGTATPECSAQNACLSGGTCSNSTCSCLLGFTGFRCADSCPSYLDETSNKLVLCNGKLRAGANCLSAAQCGTCVAGFSGTSCQLDEAKVDVLRHGSVGTSLLTVPPAHSTSEWDRRRWVLVQFNVSVLDLLGVATGLRFLISAVISEGLRPPLPRLDLCVWERPDWVYNVSAAAVCFRSIALPVDEKAFLTNLTSQAVNLSVGLWHSSALLGLRLSEPGEEGMTVVLTASEIAPATSLADCLPSPDAESDDSSTSAASQTSTAYAGLLCRATLDVNAATAPMGVLTAAPIDASFSSLPGQSSLFGNALQNKSGIAVAVVAGVVVGCCVFAFFWLRDAKKHRSYAAVSGAAGGVRRTAVESEEQQSGDEDEEFDNMPSTAVERSLGDPSVQSPVVDGARSDEVPVAFATTTSIPRHEEMVDLV
jgi:hypothetical protein